MGMVLVKITLSNTNPAIWRKILIPVGVTFFGLHRILQISMGWKNSHLFEFVVGDYKIGYIDNDHKIYEDVADASEVTFDTLLKEDIIFTYLYDFGDCWEHTIQVEKLLESGDGTTSPVCIDGQLSCPPEDSGGIFGFYDKLEILKDKKHPEYSFIKNWMGRGYNPEKFNIKKVNKELPQFKKYLKDWK